MRLWNSRILNDGTWNQALLRAHNFLRLLFAIFERNNRIVTSSLLPKLALSRTDKINLNGSSKFVKKKTHKKKNTKKQWNTPAKPRVDFFEIAREKTCSVFWVGAKLYFVHSENYTSSIWKTCIVLSDNLVPRAHVPFGQHQDTELWNNQQARSQSLRGFCF